MQDKYAILKSLGLRDFRVGQAEVIDAIVEGKNSICCMPTSAGKSLCFQIPALLKDGITLVISPLLSLMHDQVIALNNKLKESKDLHGFRAAYLNSSLNELQIRKATYNAIKGDYKIIYIAPERLETEGMLRIIQNNKVSLVIIDEAHCISQWGHDFRPDYRKISSFINRMNAKPTMAAFTATATKKVIEDIAEQLNLKNDYYLYNAKPDRPNLYYKNIYCKEKDKFVKLLEILNEHKNQSGIIYCATRNNVEGLNMQLKTLGYSCGRYHAGLEDTEKLKNQNEFVNDNIKIMLATNAFGMGIDKSNVRFVIHYNMPKSLEAYYQEAGRAGRDGLESKCYLIYSNYDIKREYSFLDDEYKKASDCGKEDLILLCEHKRKSLEAMLGYCYSKKCLRNYILKYFNFKSDTKCEKCSACLESILKLNVSNIAEYVIRCLMNLERSIKKDTIIKHLRGEKAILLENGYLSYYGDLSQSNEELINIVINELIKLEYIKKIGNNIELYDNKYPDFGNNLFIELSQDEYNKINEIEVIHTSPFIDLELFESLKRSIKELALKEGKSQTSIFNDNVIYEICKKKPKNLAELCNIKGIGRVKAYKYGIVVLSKIINHEKTTLN